MSEEKNKANAPYAELHKEAKKYETSISNTLAFKIPVFVRVECKSFKTFNRGFRKPYDPVLTMSMQQTMRQLCEEAQGCVFGYVTEGEITLILTDYHKWNSVAWMNYDVQKICSEAASAATLAFNRFFNKNKEDFHNLYDGPDKQSLYDAYKRASSTGARFAAVCFNVPEERVCEMIYYRQLDARRSSIQSLGRTYFTRKELIGKSNNEVINMLESEKNVCWDLMPSAYRIGSSCSKGVNPFSKRNKWRIDDNMPMICGNDQNYLKTIMDSVRIDDDFE